MQTMKRLRVMLIIKKRRDSIHNFCHTVLLLMDIIIDVAIILSVRLDASSRINKL